MKPVPKPKKKKTISQHKKDLDIIFSRFIRLYHADINGQVQCFTCGTVHHWTKIQNGHLFSRGRLATRFDPDNCRPQCVGCNVMAHGNYQEYFPRMIEQIGLAELELLEQKSKSEIKMSTADYMQKIAYYKTQVATMIAEIGE
jgi:hypothetical protein